jgi:hypothetical protein
METQKSHQTLEDKVNCFSQSQQLLLKRFHVVLQNKQNLVLS